MTVHTDSPFCVHLLRQEVITKKDLKTKRQVNKHVLQLVHPNESLQI